MSLSFRKVSLTAILFCVLAFAALSPALTQTPRALAASCTQDPSNLIMNGSMGGPGYSASPYGIVTDCWSPFVLSSTMPTFEWVNNENAPGDPVMGSQYIWADTVAFDAGIYQTVPGLTPGVYYQFALGYALAAYDPGDQVNHRNNLIGREVGIDLTGGTNPTAPTVAWGIVYWDGIAALNIPALSMIFQAPSTSVTVFLRVINDNVNNGRSKVWFDAVHLYAMNPQPTPNPSTIFLPLIQTSAMPPPVGPVRVSQGSVTLSTYPYAAFQRDVTDSTYNITYKQFDANAYNQSPRTPAPKSFNTVIIANDYLELTFLPDLGGRLWQARFKPTGQTVFYNNQVLKPSPWGPAQQGGWLAAGGMEWALPVDEHGYEWGIPWSYTITSNSNQATITFQDSQASDRVRAQVSVTLFANQACFVVHPRIENPTAAATHLQFWANAQLALNSKNVSSATEFIVPSTSVFVHSTGDSFIPPANVPSSGAQSPAAPLAWSIVAGRDLSRYQNWDDYLGVFADAPASDFTGAYNHANDLGIARVFPLTAASGVKLFAFGPNFGGRQLFADDGSDYFELWGGLPRTFFRDDDVTLAAGEAREWDEYWIPFAQTGGLSAATSAAVLYLNVDGNRLATIGAAATARNTRGALIVYRDGVEAARWNVSLDPGNPFRAQTSLGSGTSFRLRFIAPDGTVLAETT